MFEDIPSPVDLRVMHDARSWEQSANAKRPVRLEFFEMFAKEVMATYPKVKRILEIGSGPGFLAEHLLNQDQDLSYVMFDFSPAMHELARARLSTLNVQPQYIERSFKDKNWYSDLGQFDCILTHQTIHELRHKHHAANFHSQVLSILYPGGSYLVCDHFYGQGGQDNSELYMSIEEHIQALRSAGFVLIRQVMLKGGLVLFRAS
jgi:SAM-dependent methyltransferase